MISARDRRYRVACQQRRDRFRREFRAMGELAARANAGDARARRELGDHPGVAVPCAGPTPVQRRAEQLLAHAGGRQWRADRVMPGAVRQALYVVTWWGRSLRRMLTAKWERAGDGDDCRLREPAPVWTRTLRELAGLVPQPRVTDAGLEVCPAHGPPARLPRIASRTEALVNGP